MAEALAEWAPSLRWMRARCVSTVRALILSFSPTPFAVRPATVRSKISRSRMLREAS